MKDYTFKVPQDIVFGVGSLKKDCRSFLKKADLKR